MQTDHVHRAPAPRYDTRFDEALTTLAGYGPETCEGFSNHASMALDALVQLGHPERIEPFLQRYLPHLVAAPARPVTRRVTPSHAFDGERSYAEWRAVFDDALAHHTPRAVLADWMPVLLPGYIASAMHGVLMTTHALHALEAAETAPRIEALARGLAFWASTHQPLPGTPSRAAGAASVTQLLSALPPAHKPAHGMIDALVVERVSREPTYAELVSRGRAKEPDPIGALARAGASALLAAPEWTIALTHAVTGSVAARTLLRWLPDEHRERVIDSAFRAVAALLFSYDETRAATAPTPTLAPLDRERLVERALRTNDEHAIKLAHAALVELDATGNPFVGQVAELVCERFTRL